MTENEPDSNREVMPDREMWLFYEKRKRELANIGLTPDEYQEKLCEIVRELGI